MGQVKCIGKPTKINTKMNKNFSIYLKGVVVQMLPSQQSYSGNPNGIKLSNQNHLSSGQLNFNLFHMHKNETNQIYCLAVDLLQEKHWN